MKSTKELSQNQKKRLQLTETLLTPKFHHTDYITKENLIVAI